jgi:hypothetical protein
MVPARATAVAQQPVLTRLITSRVGYRSEQELRHGYFLTVRRLRTTVHHDPAPPLLINAIGARRRRNHRLVVSPQNSRLRQLPLPTYLGTVNLDYRAFRGRS